MERIGTVIVFKPEVWEEEAKKALEALKNLTQNKPSIYKFEDNWGYPVWYIP